jgi:pantothenate kinase
VDLSRGSTPDPQPGVQSGVQADAQADPGLVARLRRLADAAASDGRRRVLGIAGEPGAGKTTLALALVGAADADAALAGRVVRVPMDGFHHRNAELDRMGARHRKGAPDTFDAGAYAELLAAVRASPRRPLLAPAFDHAVGEPEAGAIAVDLDVDLVVTEGNYLLLDDPDWRPVRALLDEVWFCSLKGEVRRQRLVQRHVEAGRDAADATAWVERSDEANARLVAPTAAAADLVVVDGHAP